MNTPQNDGGAAFPHEAVKWNSDAGIYVKDCENYYPGMSLRDWFAGQALQTAFLYLRNTEKEECETYVDGVILKPHCDVYTSPRWIAALSYEIADAMLTARNKRQEP